MHLKFVDGYNEQEEDTEPKQPRRRKKARRSANPFINDEAGVDVVASGDKRFDDEEDDIKRFIVTDFVEY